MYACSVWTKRKATNQNVHCRGSFDHNRNLLQWRHQCPFWRILVSQVRHSAHNSVVTYIYAVFPLASKVTPLHLSKPSPTMQTVPVTMSRAIDLVWNLWLGSKHVQEAIPTQVRNDKESTTPFAGPFRARQNLQCVCKEYRIPALSIPQDLQVIQID